MPEVLAQMGGAFRDPGMPETLPNPTRLPPGMVVPGNINLQGRPIRLNPDGTVSTEFSSSFGIEGGRREVLVPTVVNGRFLTTTGQKPPEGSQEERDMLDRAQQHFEDTGEHMGIFLSPEAADVYARQVHRRPMNLQNPTYLYRPPFEGYLRQLYSKFGGGG